MTRAAPNAPPFALSAPRSHKHVLVSAGENHKTRLASMARPSSSPPPLLRRCPLAFHPHRSNLAFAPLQPFRSNSESYPHIFCFSFFVPPHFAILPLFFRYSSARPPLFLRPSPAPHPLLRQSLSASPRVRHASPTIAPSLTYHIFASLTLE